MNWPFFVKCHPGIRSLLNYRRDDALKFPKSNNVSGGSRIFTGGRQLSEGGGETRWDTILLNFPKNCMKSRKNWSLGQVGATGGA